MSHNPNWPITFWSSKSDEKPQGRKWLSPSERDALEDAKRAKREQDQRALEDYAAGTGANLDDIQARMDGTNETRPATEAGSSTTTGGASGTQT